MAVEVLRQGYRYGIVMLGVSVGVLVRPCCLSYVRLGLVRWTMGLGSQVHTRL